MVYQQFTSVKSLFVTYFFFFLVLSTILLVRRHFFGVWCVISHELLKRNAIFLRSKSGIFLASHCALVGPHSLEAQCFHAHADSGESYWMRVWLEFSNLFNDIPFVSTWHARRLTYFFAIGRGAVNYPSYLLCIRVSHLYIYVYSFRSYL